MRSEAASPKLFVAALALLLLFPQLPLRPAQSSQAQQPGIRVQVNLVNLFATVRDKKTKQIISSLQQDDFKIAEDGVEQKISFFSRESTLPITLGLLIDTSGSETNMLGAEQEAAVRFLSRVMRKGDLAMVVSFDTDSDLLADLTDDQGRLDRAINRTRINAPSAQGPLAQSIPGTVFYDAVYAACHDRLAEEAGRKALVILTDAQDEGSTLKLQDAIEAAQRTDTVVHILLIGDSRFGGGNESIAKKLTDETGGRTIVVRSEKNLEQAFDQISEELRSQYTLGYYSSNTARDGSYRKVRVETSRKDLEVLARRGYYAPKN
ncbi:MAG TPA: VWA domain-containing protein [Candidatus Acidoferrales bacterium]|nr:VWA domain-containing protein [Candidatus Acidoferrales bacterium]